MHLISCTLYKAVGYQPFHQGTAVGKLRIVRATADVTQRVPSVLKRAVFLSPFFLDSTEPRNQSLPRVTWRIVMRHGIVLS